MSNSKLTDSEIKKALECAIRNDCDCNCVFLLPNKVQDVLDLINRLQAENERLENFKAYFDFYFGCDIEILGIDENGDTTSFDEFYNCAIANAESIEHHIAHIIKTAKAEAYKECIEKVRKLAVGMHPCSDEMRIFDSDLDNLLKELVGENNAEEKE